MIVHYVVCAALDGVAMEESRDQFINPGQIFGYIGEGKGIQGHQNSCYLDSTVFGLFAVSDVFDNMFLEQKAHDPAGDEVKYLLWKGIVNPLRKWGSAMNLWGGTKIILDVLIQQSQEHDFFSPQEWSCSSWVGYEASKQAGGIGKDERSKPRRKR